MSLAQRAKRGVRIIALPLATSAAPAHKASHHLTYYHFFTPPPRESEARSWSNLIITKVAHLRAGLGKAPEGNWKTSSKRRAFLYGERFIDRLDFEELALKSFDTSLGPKLLPLGHTDKLDANGHPTRVPRHWRTCMPCLRNALPRHWNGCLVWIAISPLAAPLKLIPISPRFPFFFCAWRAWSHYRAFKASQYLQASIAQGAILSQESAELDTTYQVYAPASLDPAPSCLGADPSSMPSASPLCDQRPTLSNATTMERDARPRLLITRAAVPALERLFALPPGSSFASDVYRALEQARLRLQAKL
ncbi:predicted protein [Postia placenta Mad-698-R]|uniref:Uncharacterized protein n=1 Tax=Postia placenta MAD-698-R-SB12 TaxID=670580 RepID=A0A1X6N463_9APHY|nr:hypothetical protein POSPLADRAFT_1045681 [Postia placenta MAD-698-R-SB12]EED85930.1 predicted protein [Postia placenta Mad-698-R]OSX63320.1 hypothetical protein POSPLADRAFT_1045681 [Postia placenta MAD-698-R-SB12]